MMNIISCNCRVMGNKNKVESVKDLIQIENPIVLLLHETKLEVVESLSNCMKQWNCNDHKLVSSKRVSRGLCTLWNNSILHLNYSLQMKHWLLTSLTLKQSGEVFNIVNVYMPTTYIEKVECWDSFSSIRGSYYQIWSIMVGEIKTTLSQKEKLQGRVQ